MRKNVASVVIAFLLALVDVAGAQVLTGSIIGVIRDESGAVLPGVTVTLTSPAHPAGPLTVTTGSGGDYRFTQLAPGSYTLTVTLAGFSTYAEEGLIVGVAGTIQRDVRLVVGGLAETITVGGESPMVDPRSVGTGMNISQEVFENLPTRRHHFAEQIKWAPGVSADNPSARTAISVLGSATGENSTLYEGISTETGGGGTPFMSSDADAVEEIAVSTLGSSAEYPGAAGGVFSVIFKQGTNAYRGDGSAFFNLDSLTSRPIKVDCRCPLGQTGFTILQARNYAAHFGGPILRDKLWFFAGGVYSAHIEMTPGGDPTPLGDWLWYSHRMLTKLTWQIGARTRFQQTIQLGPYGGQAVPTLARPFETQTANYGNTLVYGSEVNHTISASTLLTVRATGFDTAIFGRTVDPLSGDFATPIRTDQLTGIATGGVPNFGQPSGARHGQAVRVSRYIRRPGMEHDVRFGFQLDRGDTHARNTLPSGVNYADVGGAPDQATFRDPYVSGAAYSSQGIWMEDEVTLGGRLTFSVGVRFDRFHAVSPDVPAVDQLLEPTGATIQGLGEMFTWKVWSPRVGFNLKLTSDNKTILRGNYGRAYRGVRTDEFSNVHPGLSPITLARWNPATGSYSTIISVTDPTANVAFDSDIDAPYTDQFSLGLDRELAANVAVGATYVYKDGQKHVGWRDIGGVYGTRDEVLPDGRTVAVHPLLNSTRDRLYLRTNGEGTFNRYHGLLLTMAKRFSHRWQANVGYTYSKAEAQLTTGQDPNDNINAGGRFELDRPHMLTVVSSYEIPRIGVQATANFMALSGTPYAPQALVQLPQGRRSVNIEPAGDYRLPSVRLLYVRFNKELFRRGERRVLLGAEITNALQDKGANAVISRNFFSPTFGQASEWHEPRRLQLIARVKF